MFFKKKQEAPVVRWADSRMEDLYGQFSDALTNLQRLAKKVYIKKEALTLYETDKPDWDIAVNDLYLARQSLTTAIKTYDDIVDKMKHHYEHHRDEMRADWCNTFYSSHEQIEMTIANFLRDNLWIK